MVSAAATAAKFSPTTAFDEECDAKGLEYGSNEYSQMSGAGRLLQAS
jgi:hypothetical protein